MQKNTMNANSNPGTPTAQVTAVISFPVLVGTIVAYGGGQSSIPPGSGWLLCDGSQFDQAKYPDLAAVLGNSNRVPDLRGYFLRGLDTSGSVDPDGSGRKLLTPQESAFQTHHHVTNISPLHWPNDGGKTYVLGSQTTDNLTSQPSSDAGEAKETRPINVAVHYVIFAGLPR